MCILSYLAPGIAVDEEGLLNGGIANPDGHGWAIADDGKMFIGKSMDLQEALDGFIVAREKRPNGHALFHSRYATHGTKDTYNVHPFRAGHSEGTVVAHNGVLPFSIWPDKGDNRSDTHKFADELLSTRYRRLDKTRARQALADWIGSGNKLVILTVDPRYQHNVYLINKSQGNTDPDTGIWHSNYDYEGWANYGKWTSKGTKWSGTATTPTTIGGRYRSEQFSTLSLADCYICGMGEMDEQGYCDQCRSCNDCCEHIRDCFCWQRDRFLSASEVAEIDARYELDDSDGLDYVSIDPDDVNRAVLDMGDVADDIRAEAAAAYAARYGEEYDSIAD